VRLEARDKKSSFEPWPKDQNGIGRSNASIGSHLEVDLPIRGTTNKESQPMLGTKEVKESISVATSVANVAISLQSTSKRR
jgi:hypothetical protein